MRPSRFAGLALLALSTATAAQVARTPDAKDTPYANMAPANQATANAQAGPGMAGNDMAPATPDQKTEPAQPRR